MKKKFKVVKNDVKYIGRTHVNRLLSNLIIHSYTNQIGEHLSVVE
jgi:hypothetical protein